MSVTHPTAIRDDIANFIAAKLDGGSLVFYQADGIAVVATLPLSATAFAVSSSGVASANTITSDTSALLGVTTVAKLLAANSDIIVECSVGMTGGADIELSSNDIAANDTIAVSALTYEAPL